MTRVATIPLQRALSSAIQKSQQSLANSQLQLATEKKVNDYAGLGTDAVRTLSARSMLAQQQSYQSVASQVSTTLSLYDTNITQIDDIMSDMRTELMTMLGTEDSPGLQDMIENSFSGVRNALNATSGGVYIFAGSQINDAPMSAQTLDDLVGITPEEAFTNDQFLQSARISDGQDLEYGIVASDIGTGLIPVFQTLAAAGPFGDKLTDAQKTAIEQAINQLDEGLADVRSVNGANGRKQNYVDSYKSMATDRANLMTEIIGSVEDADLGQVAIDISQRQTILEASYSVFSQLSNLSLATMM